VLEARDPLGVTPGSRVGVRLPDGGVWLAMGLVYAWPLFMLFIGAVLGHRLGASGGDAELSAALGGLLGLGCGFGVLRVLRPHYEVRASLRPVIVSVSGETGREAPKIRKNAV
jgi:positive regulator of sigma E activity